MDRARLVQPSGSTSVIVTYAMPSGLRSRVPAKITSSMRAPRRLLARLLAQHPTDGIAEVGLAAAVRPDDGGDAGAVEPHLGAVAEGLESLEFDAS